MDLTLSWALPVRVEVLAAHLQAYLETLPTINTLRLCNRFGTGPEAYINKLPIELVQHIEAELVEPIRQVHVSNWASDLRCFEQTCTIEDHWTREELLDMYWDCVEGRSMDSEDEISSTNRTNEELARELGLHESAWWEDHHGSREAWRKRVGWPAYSDESFLTKHQARFFKLSGLKTWVSHVRLDPDSSPHHDDWDPCETTVAYLVMPTQTRLIENWELSQGEAEMGDYAAETRYGIPVNIHQPPTARSLQRFSRILKILGLEVSLHASQKGAALESADPKSDVAVDSAAGAPSPRWPRLLLLARGRSVGF